MQDKEVVSLTQTDYSRQVIYRLSGLQEGMEGTTANHYLGW